MDSFSWELSRLTGLPNLGLPDVLLYTEAYTALPTYYRSVEPLLKGPLVKKHVALLHGGSFIPGDVMAWEPKWEGKMLDQYDLLIAPSQYHYELQYEVYPSIPMVVARWPLNNDVHDIQEDDIPPRHHRVDRLIFPHRMIPEKGWPLFASVIRDIDPGDWTLTATHKGLSRHDYLQLLAESKAVFASATMETYGVAIEEAMALDCCPVLNRHPVYLELYGQCDVHWHDETVSGVMRALRDVQTCSITHYDVDRSVSMSRSQRILQIAAEA